MPEHDSPETDAPDHDPPNHSSGSHGTQVRQGLVRWVWLGLGFVAVGLGTIGVIVPGLPTTVFFIVAAGCFSRSSPRFEQWVLSLPKIGPAVGDYRAGLGMPRRAKIMATSSIAIVCALSAVVFVDELWIRATIIAAGAVGIGWILWRVPTRTTT